MGKSYKITFPSSLYTNVQSINNILNQFHGITPEYSDVIFDTENLKWIDSEISALLGALFENLNTRRPDLTLFLRHHTKPTESEKLLFKNNFLEHYLSDSNYHATTTGYTVKFSVIKITNGGLKKSDLSSVSEYLHEELFSHPKWGANFETYENQLGFSESIFELARNISDHSRSENLIFAGQYYPNKNEFRLAISDNGLGIPLTVKTGAQINDTDVNLIDWATKPGNTSKSGKQPRGMGLSYIGDSLIGNGELIIVSGNGFWKLNRDGIISKNTLSQKFNGTYVRISFLNDRIKKQDTNQTSTTISAELPF
ncbi:ATP-binding region, ATPase-like [Weissella jogaejeotgali]|uniref:ATP-binding region, ATPase-like n=1 Tax=Weissella jogaejeotgali TaxID=1631871 RepID=A0A1L6R8X8_9LACO|nr:ATP-binding region, ATPase-like [Weissella jogaejeotgali]